VAQTTPGNTQLQCSTNVTVTPNLRGEGYTEQTGDITLTCTGGVTPSIGSVIPAVNITVFYNTQVTSRLLPTSASSSISEALLLIDEPGSGLPAPVPGYGPAASQNLCATPLQGCTQFVSAAVNGANPPIPVATTSTLGLFTPSGVAATNTTNVFQGVVTGNSVTFFGIPVLAPGTTSSRIYRITNVRVNANPLAGGSASGASPVQASISISGATSLLISNPTPYVGFVTNGLAASVSGSTTSNQCASQTLGSVTTLRFAENFGTAFKTRVAAQNNLLYAGQNSAPGTGGFAAQNVPGGIYNSESNFIYPVSSTQVAGLADYGTRLKAVFNNLPTGVRVFVSTANVLNNNFPVAAPAVIGGSAANSGTVGYAQLVNGETTPDGNAGVSGFFPAITATTNGPNNGNVPVVEVPITNGSGSAVWEVVNTNPSTNETFQFAVYITYTANVAQNTPAPGTSTVNLSYAPTPPIFTASAGAAPSSTLTIPRFVSDASSARSILIIQICRTILLFPYVTNQAGFDTGLEIANTSLDPFTTGSNTTAAQAGSCRMTWYGGTTAAPTTPPGPSDTGSIAGGTIYVNTAQTLVPNFQGYMIAVCNFQYAHGFAFISDIGARNLAMGYLAVVIPDPGTGARTATPPCQGISGCSTTGEQGGH